ncbi:MAG TPA: hypothetical protein PKL78_11655 [Anaerolineales bacterium]|nr:hypothetical protein [Anaerolineales bacterium]HNO30734.1 hypothetical protein [Anaerolineales bacterium]
MLILISCLLFFVTTLALVALRVAQPNARYAWLVAVIGAGLALISVFLWPIQSPLEFALPAWQPVTLFTSPLLLRADGISWPLAVSIAALTLSILLTAVTIPVYVNTLTWAGILALGGFGLLAVTANNPVTLLMAWALLDFTELVSQLFSVNGSVNTEKVVVSFAARAFGIGLLTWAGALNISSGRTFDFQTIAANSGAFVVLAAGFRLGGLPLHLPYSSESSLRRGFGTAIRLISSASSLAVLGRISTEGLITSYTPYLLGIALVAAIYGGWMWLRAPDELNGRPFWVIGVSALAVASALGGNSLGAIAWGCALVLAGGALFLAAVQNVWVNRILLAGVWGLSSLPFSLTAVTWTGRFGLFLPLGIIAQALILAGYIRHVLRSTGRDSLDGQPGWARAMYPAGIVLLIILIFLFGFTGWDGALQIGAWPQALLASLLTGGLFWASRRFRIFTPIRAHWISNAGSRIDNLFAALWSLYRGLGRLSQTVTVTLEGEGGIMWTLLFLVLFISLLTQGIR